MGRKYWWGRRRKAGRPDTTTAVEPTDNPNDPPNHPENTATVETAKDPPIHTSNQREESSAINLNVALDDDVLDESPPNELKNTTIDQTKKILYYCG